MAATIFRASTEAKYLQIYNAQCSDIHVRQAIDLSE